MDMDAGRLLLGRPSTEPLLLLDLALRAYEAIGADLVHVEREDVAWSELCRNIIAKLLVIVGVELLLQYVLPESLSALSEFNLFLLIVELGAVSWIDYCANEFL
ncbi:hypothetical protein ACHHYP_10708 [Achlya hypogyna]|uniref:Uncharacterized protein n=1 Tax=Achlya hypogyna TaxID=1202772 RepID=A0A1V9YKR8_ACHHY|nr:hypothetical protein ACHHYP_10708 [Achlya hypogyna]